MSRVIQLRRRKGWRKPEGAVVVARPSRWGNPFTVGEDAANRGEAVAKFEAWVQGDDPRAQWIREHVHELDGRTLACWCPQPGPCHALVLARMADEASSEP